MRISDWSSDVCASDLAGAAKSRRGRSPDLRQGSADCLAVGSHGGFGAVEVEFDGMAAALAEDAGDGGFEGGAVVVDAAGGAGVGAVGRGGGRARSEEGGVGKECVGAVRDRWARVDEK